MEAQHDKYIEVRARELSAKTGEPFEETLEVLKRPMEAPHYRVLGWVVREELGTITAEFGLATGITVEPGSPEPLRSVYIAHEIGHGESICKKLQKGEPVGIGKEFECLAWREGIPAAKELGVLEEYFAHWRKEAAYLGCYPPSEVSNPNTAIRTCYSDEWLYHATTYDTYHDQIRNYGIIPKPLTGDVAAIVGFDSGIYLANSTEAVKDLAMLKYGEGEYIVLNVKLLAGTQLEIDPEIGEPDSPWFITPSMIPPGNVILLDVGGQPPVGTCYPDAWRFLIKQDEGHLIHGSVQLTAEGARVNHAWVELPTGWVWEPQTKGYYTVEDFKIMNPIEEHRYTGAEAAIMAARTSSHGPWTDEDRAEWLRR